MQEFAQTCRRDTKNGMFSVDALPLVEDTRTPNLGNSDQSFSGCQFLEAEMKTCLMLFAILLTAVTLTMAQNSGARSARLFCGTDETGFAGMNGQLALVNTVGPSVTSQVHLYNLNVPLNGITASNGRLWAGQPEDVLGISGNTLQEISAKLPPAVLATVAPGSNSFSNSCCNEQMLVTANGFYHVHYGDSIQQLMMDSSGNSEVVRTYSQSDIVGIASDGTQIWISNWNNRQVGTWDPTTNVFTPVFSTPANAGGLAWDVANGVLWVGMEGGSVIPYDASGNQLGPGFQPFGSDSDTIDGLAFIP